LQPIHRSPPTFEEFRELEERVEVLERCVAVLTARRKPRDAEDAALLAAVLSIGGTFRIRTLLTHGKKVRDFGRLLLAADLTKGADLGYWLRRHKGVVIDGRYLDAIDKDEDGTIWAVLTI
jgi:hypothetical protein